MVGSSGQRKLFIVPTTAITETDRKLEERKWQTGKNLPDTYHNMCTALQQLFERAINTAYHSGKMTNTGMARQDLGNEKIPTILERHKRLFGTPSLQELYQAHLCLHNPMYRNQPVEVMLPTNEEVQMFLMEHPYGDCELSAVNIISYNMIKLSKCGGLCTKSIKRWQNKTK